MLLDLEPGDTVIVPSFTFSPPPWPSSAGRGTRLRRHRARDARPRPGPRGRAHRRDTCGAVVVVHYAGIACDVRGHAVGAGGPAGVDLIEDNAHGLFGTLAGPAAGQLRSVVGRQSFHETKNFDCGEGGALVLNDPPDVDRASVLYDKGTNRRAVHARPGRQVHLAGHGLVLRARRRSRRLPARPARAAGGHPGQAPGRARALHAGARAAGGGAGLRADADAVRERVGVPHVLRPLPEPATAGTTCWSR